MKKLKFAAVAFLFALAGCSTSPTEDYRPRFSEYVGLPEKELITAFGLPDFAFYEDERNYVVYNTNVSDASRGVYGAKYCQTIFMVVRGVVRASYYNSSKCIFEK